MTKEEAVYKIMELVQGVHREGLFISGCITVDIAQPCPSCNMQMILKNRGGLVTRVCPKCESAGGQHISIKPPNHGDAPMCIKCGGMMIRKGTCYACLDCGETSGCS